jgi:uncharacterized protein YkwD
MYRSRHHVGDLVLTDNLNNIAQNYARTIAESNRFEHSGNGLGENLYFTCPQNPNIIGYIK